MLFKLPAKVSYKSLPWVIYTTPEVAQTGIILNTGKSDKTRILVFNYKSNDRAQAGLSTDGLIKVAVNKKGYILGVAIAGDGAGELISQWTIAIKNKLKIKHMASFIVPYPTLSEINKRVAGSYFTPILYSAKIKRLVKFLLKWL